MSDETEENIVNFHEMQIDDRLLKGIAKLGWVVPTMIQEKAIPLLLEGKDVLIRARTGSGKTAAFAVPVVELILKTKLQSTRQEITAIILAPSRELCAQTHKVFENLTFKCSRDVRCLDISPQVPLSTQKPMLVEKPDIIIGTPTRVLQHIDAKNINVQNSLKILVIDEADLVFSFGHETQVKILLTHFPKIYQAVLASATLSEDMINLKSLVLHNPVILKLEEPDLAPSSQLTHYHLAAEELDKVTILYAILKLNLIRGKSLIFVNTVDKCYKIKLFLEQFKIRTCVLNSELPAKIRCHSVNQFNMGLYDIIIASDEKALEDAKFIASDVKRHVGKWKRRKDSESGVSRGIDFQCVSNVINLDFPLDVNSYVHRAGRTARGNNQGSVLSFVSIRERPLMNEVEKFLKQGLDVETDVMKAYQFKIDEIEAFKYRAQDAWKAVTRIAVREARLKEIKTEIFNCQKLTGYFEDNPTDLQVLRHDKVLHTVRQQSQLADVPDYIIPPTLKNLVDTSSVTKKRKTKFKLKPGKNQVKYAKKKSDPLLSMEFSGIKKMKTD